MTSTPANRNTHLHSLFLIGITLSLLLSACNETPQKAPKAFTVFPKDNCNMLVNSLSDFRAQSSYIRLKVRKGANKRVMIIQNYPLFLLIREKMNLSRNEYKDFLRSLIDRQKPLELTETEWLEYEEYLLPKDFVAFESAETDSIKKVIFPAGVQLEKIPNEALIIDALIRDSLRVMRDDESGVLIIQSCD